MDTNYSKSQSPYALEEDKITTQAEELPSMISHLQLGDVQGQDETPSVDAAPALTPISVDRDNLTDEEYMDFDRVILECFEGNRLLGRVPPSVHLLVILIAFDTRLVRRSVTEAQDLIEKNPTIEGLLKDAWNQGSFKKVCQLEILWPPQPRAVRYDLLKVRGFLRK